MTSRTARKTMRNDHRKASSGQSGEGEAIGQVELDSRNGAGDQGRSAGEAFVTAQLRLGLLHAARDERR